MNKGFFKKVINFFLQDQSGYKTPGNPQWWTLNKHLDGPVLMSSLDAEAHILEEDFYFRCVFSFTLVLF